MIRTVVDYSYANSLKSFDINKKKKTNQVISVALTLITTRTNKIQTQIEQLCIIIRVPWAWMEQQGRF